MFHCNSILHCFPYLHNLISVQRAHSTLPSSVITHARPPTSSSLEVTNIATFIMPHLVSGINSLYFFVNHILVPVPLFLTHLFRQISLLIRYFARPLSPLSFTLGLKPRSLPVSLSFPIVLLSFLTAFMDYCPDHFFWATQFLFLVFLIFRFCAMC